MTMFCQSILKMSVLMFALGLVGCASGKAEADPLELENILQQNAKRTERLKSQEEQTQQELEAIRAEIQKMEEAEKVTPLSEIYENTELEPKELGFLELPGIFYVLGDKAWEASKIQQIVQARFPEASLGWRAKALDILVLVGTQKIDAEKMSQMTGKDFERDLRRFGDQFERFYQDHYKARSSFNVRKLKNLTSIKITSKYIENDAWYTDDRYIFFYQKDYRLSLFIRGKDDDLQRVREDMNSGVLLFEKRLAQYFE